MYDQEEEEEGSSTGALGAIAGLEDSGPLSRDALMAEARKFVDPKAKFRAAAAGVMKPTGGHFSEAYGNALAAYNASADREAELTARYFPIVQKAALARRAAEAKREAEARSALDSLGASALLDPELTPEKLSEGVRGLVTQGRVPGQMADQFMKSLPQDPARLRPALTQRAIAATDPYRAVKTPAVEKYGEGDIGYSVDPVTGARKKVAEGGTKAGDFSRSLSELMSMAPNDPRRPMLEAYLQKLTTHPPAASLSVNAEKPLINSFMGELGKSAGAQRDAAVGAQASIGTANRLLDALSRPGVISGPGADAEILLRQVAEYGGFGGKDNRERLANTANAVQAMAQAELDAAAQMKGQGAITEGERKLLSKAAIGKIALTAPEIRTLAEISKRRALRRIQSYNDYAKRLGALPGLEKMAPLLEVEDPDVAEELRFDDQGRPVK